MIQLSVINNSPYDLPKYATDLSAGLDLKAVLNEGVTLAPLERKVIGTGIRIALSDGYEAQVRPRSGLAAKNNISVLNTPGTIDSDYRGEIKVILYNDGKEDFLINNKDRIAQMVLTPVIKINFEETEELPETIRGEGGFGSTGK